MFLPHNCSSYLAGVIAMVVDGNPPMGVVADVIAKVVDGIATGSMF